MRILQVCYKMPFPLHDGGEYSIHNSTLSLLLQPNTSVKTLALNTRKNWVDPSAIPLDYATKTNLEWVAIDTRIQALNMLKALTSKRSYFVQRFYSEEFKDKLVETLTNESFDIVQLEHLYLCQYIDDIRSVFSGKVILRTQNVEYNVWESYLQNVRSLSKRMYLKIETKKLKRYESAIIDKMDGIITLSQQDKSLYRTLTNRPIVSIPIGFDHRKIEHLDIEKQFSSPPIIYHLGSMDWLPNVQGIRWFIHEVLPILLKLEPTIEIHLAGKKMPREFYASHSSNLIIDGEIDLANQYIEDKSILIVPLLSGSGIRVKIIEAMALGKSIVSTTLGAQGINAVHEENMLIADTTEDFAKAVQRCYNSLDLRKKLSTNAQKTSREDYDLVEVGRQKMNFYTHLIEHAAL